ncbi:MAG: hypothetical protein ACRD3S_16125 [Terracidiphilus sp.]
MDMITPAVNIHRLGGWIIGTFQAAFLLFVVALTVAVGAWIFGSHIVLLGAISVGGLGLVVIGHVVTAAQRRLQ